jgi:integrase
MFNNVLHQRSLRTRSKTEAAQLEAVFRASLVRGEFGIIESRRAPTLGKFEERLLPHLKANTAPRTYGFYVENLTVLKRFTPLASCKLGSIDSALIENFVQWRLKEKVSAVTVNHSLRTLRRALHLAKKWKLVRDVPVVSLLPGEHEREAVIEEPILKLMISYITKAYPHTLMQHLLPFLVDSGLRISEACNLERQHVTFDDGCAVAVRVVKGKSKYSKREVPLTPRAASALEACLAKSKCEYVFTGKGGKHPLTRHYPSEQFRVIRDALNLDQDMVLHSTRHTYCTNLGAAGVDAFTIQKLAGHSSILISQRYVHSDAEAKQNAIKLLGALTAKKNTPKAPSDKVKEI